MTESDIDFDQNDHDRFDQTAMQSERFTEACVWMKSASCRVVMCFWLYTALA